MKEGGGLGGLGSIHYTKLCKSKRGDLFWDLSTNQFLASENGSQDGTSIFVIEYPNM